MKTRSCKRRARPRRSILARPFTLVELLTTISIIMILMSMLMPALSKAIRIARKTECGAQLSTWYLGIQASADDHAGVYPGVIMWDLNDRFSTIISGSHQAWAVQANEDIGNYITSEVIKCPARTEPRGSSPYKWPMQGNTYWNGVDYFMLFGQSTYPASGGYAQTDGYWVEMYFTQALADGRGPVPNRSVSRETDTPLMFDRCFIDEVVALADNSSSCGSSGQHDCDWGDCGGYCYQWQFNGISNHNEPGKRNAEGGNFLLLDGSWSYYPYAAGRWKYYAEDYFNEFWVPDDAFMR